MTDRLRQERFVQRTDRIGVPEQAGGARRNPFTVHGGRVPSSRCCRVLGFAPTPLLQRRLSIVLRQLRPGQGIVIRGVTREYYV